jgi:hypothetical protein
MPVAVTTMARALGVGTKELFKMMENGELIASEVLPKFANELRKTARQGGALAAGMNTVTAAQSRMSTAWTIAIGEMMDTGGKQGVVDIFDLLTTTIQALTPAFKVLGTVLKYIGSILKTVLTPVINTVGYAFSALQGFIDGVDQRLTKLGQKIEKVIRPFKAFLDAYQVLQETLGGEKNSLDAAADVLFQTERGKYLEQKMNNAMVKKGYDSFKPSASSTSRVNNVTVNFTANGTDPKGVMMEFDKMWQNTMKGLSTGPN